jgi:hypothetical protein
MPYIAEEEIDCLHWLSYLDDVRIGFEFLASLSENRGGDR